MVLVPDDITNGMLAVEGDDNDKGLRGIVAASEAVSIMASKVGVTLAV